MNSGTLWGNGVCTLCGEGEFLSFFEAEGMPAQDGVLWSSRAEALRAPRGDISLSLCLHCGYVGNRLFQPELLKFVGYNVSQEHSPLYQKFIDELVTRLVQRYGLRNRTVLEVGCGNGYFLKAICAAGENKGVGFDPSYAGEGLADPDSQGIMFIKDYYSERHGKYKGDLICCRQVIDHLGNPKTFLTMIRRAMGDRHGVVYFEVPNPERRFRNLVPWNVGYEHGSWFFPEAFRALFELTGFEVKDVAPCHSGEYLGIEALPAPKPDLTALRTREAAVRKLAGDLKTRSHQCRETIAAWKMQIEEFERNSTRVIPWGAGERGIGFLSSLNVRDLMPCIVDINPDRVGKFIPGTGQQVVPPSFLVEYKPDVIIVMNRTYLPEIKQQATALGITATVLAI